MTVVGVCGGALVRAGRGGEEERKDQRSFGPGDLSEGRGEEGKKEGEPGESGDHSCGSWGVGVCIIVFIVGGWQPYRGERGERERGKQRGRRCPVLMNSTSPVSADPYISSLKRPHEAFDTILAV